ncbi:MAG: aldehyde dehydrogenase family protein [Polyangiaceae bacterium]|nr:aldehyde dehydrogenase family protein [Polyangiaceae bacterium]
MYVGGAFVRSESGRYLQVAETMAPGENGTMENVPRGSRKDARDAVVAAHAALSGWSRRAANNRGQILYRLAEMLDARSEELERSLVRSGLSAADARAEVGASVDRTLSYAGWSDKYHSLFASLNPVAGPHFDFTIPEPVGLVVIAAPARPALLGLVGSILPVIVGGNVCIVVASEEDPRTAVTFAEALATSDLPGGVVNILTGHHKEILPPLAKHMDVQALDLHGTSGALLKELTDSAADSVKRVRSRDLKRDAWFDHEACTTPLWIERFVEMKTIWHPSGA